MKFLDLPSLTLLNTWLGELDCSGRPVRGHLEAYSCKKTASERRFYKELSTSQEALGSSVPLIQPLASSAVSLNNSSANAGSNPNSLSSSSEGLEYDDPQLFVHLIAALNAAHTDYDFSSAKRSFFVQHSLYDFEAAVQTALSGAQYCGKPADVASIFATLETDVGLSNAVVFEYEPPSDFDPYADEEDVLWARNFLIYSKALKRVVIFVLECERPVIGPISPSVTPSLPSTFAVRDQQTKTDYSQNNFSGANFNQDISFCHPVPKKSRRVTIDGIGFKDCDGPKLGDHDHWIIN